MDRLIVIPESELRDLLHSIISDSLDEKLKSVEPEKEQSKKEDRLFSVKEISEFLGVAQITIHRWKKKGLIPYKKIGKRVFFDQRKVMGSFNDYKLDFKSGS